LEEEHGVAEEHLEEASRNIRATLETYDVSGTEECPNCRQPAGLSYVLTKVEKADPRAEDKISKVKWTTPFIKVESHCENCGFADVYETSEPYTEGQLDEGQLKSALQYMQVHYNVKKKGWGASGADMPGEGFNEGEPKKMREKQKRAMDIVENPRTLGTGMGKSKKLTGKGVPTASIHRPSYGEIVERKNYDPETGEPPKKKAGRPKRRGSHLNQEQENPVIDILRMEEDGFESADDREDWGEDEE
jgi:hypothetical protein